MTLLVECLKDLHCSCIIHAYVHASLPWPHLHGHANRRGGSQITSRASAGMWAFSSRSKSRSLDPGLRVFMVWSISFSLLRGSQPEKKNVAVGDAGVCYGTPFA